MISPTLVALTAALAAAPASDAVSLIAGSRALRLPVAVGPHELHGDFAGAPAAVRTTEHEISGDVGGDPVRLSFTPLVISGFRTDGEIGGKEVALELRPLGIDGDVGDCTYHLPWTGQGYSGWGVCGRAPPEKIELRLPAQLSRAAPSSRAAVIALSLWSQDRAAAPPPGTPAPGTPAR